MIDGAYNEMADRVSGVQKHNSVVGWLTNKNSTPKNYHDIHIVYAPPASSLYYDRDQVSQSINQN